MLSLSQIAAEIRSLTVEERKQLISLIVDSLTEPQSEEEHNILELEGLGAEIWQGIDAQEYVHQLRNEWDQRP
jgi:hypothetical protein